MFFSLFCVFIFLINWECKGSIFTFNYKLFSQKVGTFEENNHLAIEIAVVQP